MLTMTPAGQTAQDSERPHNRRWWSLVVWLAVAAALGVWIVAGLRAPSGDEPSSSAVDPLDA